MRTLQLVLRVMVETHGQLSEERAAKLVFTSIRTFRRTFTQMTRTSFRRKSHEIKLDRAQVLLDTRDWSVTRIAADLGYSERSKLDKAFARSRGLNPVQYRAGRQAR